MFTNTEERFGSLTKMLHWSIFLLFIGQFFLVYRREYFPKNSPEKLQYILLHESIGVVLLVLALFMIVWRHVGTRPVMPASMSTLHVKAAKLMHFLLYAVMLFQPISGIFMSQYAGYPVGVFGLFDLPTLVHKNEAIGHLLKEAHELSSYAIIGLVSLHIIAALYHHFIIKDNVLKRMLPQ
ncbi:MAG: cytochrome b [Proteobacteria bacterium]|nr:cytochrome b [Pseudomonadota bacterium]